MLQMTSAAQAFFAVGQLDAESVVRQLFDHCSFAVPASGLWVLELDDFLFFEYLGTAAAEVITVHILPMFAVTGCRVDGT